VSGTRRGDSDYHRRPSPSTHWVVDVSHLDADGQASYAARLAAEIEAHRVATGLPQWVAIDEAHGPVGRAGAARTMFNPAAKGYLLITWKPGELSADVLASLDAVLALGSPCPDAFVDLTAAVAGVARADIARLLDGPSGRAVLAWRQYPGQPVAFTVGTRATAHLRQQHKYDLAGLEPAHRFHFRTEPGTPTGTIAANLADLEAQLANCDESVVRNHCPGHDFSRWVADVFHDRPLPADLAAAEASLARGGPAAVVEQVRLALIAALQDRGPR
jgi:hypothetical protein